MRGPSGTVSFSELTGGFRFRVLLKLMSVRFPSPHWTSGFPASSELNASESLSSEFLEDQLE